MRKALTGAPGRSGPPALHPAVYAAQFAKMGAFVLLVWGTIGAGRAEAIPIVHDQVKTIVFLAELPENAPVRKEAKDPGGKPTKLGYRYWYFHIFWASVWTWDGEFVAYQHEWVNPIRLGTDPKAAAEKAGLDPDAVYPPFFYRFPLGWWIAGVLFLLWSWKKLVEKGEPEQPQAPSALELQLLADERYQKALAAMNIKEQPLDQLSMSEIQRGLDLLIEQGIPREEAEQNLGLLLEYLRQQQQPEAT